jgi:hypothetical protein
MNTTNSVVGTIYAQINLIGGNVKPNIHPYTMNGSPGDVLMAQAVREGILDGTASYETTESGILLTKTKVDSFIIKPNFGIHMPELNSGIILAR